MTLLRMQKTQFFHVHSELLEAFMSWLTPHAMKQFLKVCFARAAVLFCYGFVVHNMASLLLPAQGLAAAAFSQEVVKSLAAELAKKPYQDRKLKIEGDEQPLTYDEYRDIKFNPAKAIWKQKPTNFQLHLFAPGGLYNKPVEIFLVEKGTPRKLNFEGDRFHFGDFIRSARPAVMKKFIQSGAFPDIAQQAEADKSNSQGAKRISATNEHDGANSHGLSYTGFRIHGFINNRRVRDEFTVFQGASYFRSVGRGQNYGLSARGLAINTAEPMGEEFPYFRSFWVEYASRSRSITVHALLDSPSTTGAYKFIIRPGKDTVIDVKAELYPRKDVQHLGLAPLTSMFQFGHQHSRQFNDFRPAVHDSEGLLMLNGQNEWLWRPLRNPKDLQISSFVDENPKGFGLIQRTRDFDNYRDLEARYDTRPSLWIEPKGDWGKGAVTLYEIPTESEINDNIVAMWKPQRTLKAGQSYSFSYRMYWGVGALNLPPRAKVEKFMIGAASESRKRFVIDFVGRPLRDIEMPKVRASVSRGVLSNVVVQRNSVTNGWRVTYLLNPKSAESIDIRLSLTSGEKDISEVFLYRWTKDK